MSRCVDVFSEMPTKQTALAYRGIKCLYNIKQKDKKCELIETTKQDWTLPE